MLRSRPHLPPRCRHKVPLPGLAAPLPPAALQPPTLRPAYCLLPISHMPEAMSRSRHSYFTHTSYSTPRLLQATKLPFAGVHAEIKAFLLLLLSRVPLQGPAALQPPTQRHLSYPPPGPNARACSSLSSPGNEFPATSPWQRVPGQGSLTEVPAPLPHLWRGPATSCYTPTIPPAWGAITLLLPSWPQRSGLLPPLPHLATLWLHIPTYRCQPKGLLQGPPALLPPTLRPYLLPCAPPAACYRGSTRWGPY